MKKLRIPFIFACIAVLTLISNTFLLFHFGYSRQPEEDYPFPKTGTWQCQELGIPMSFDEGKCIFFDGKDTIECYVLRERGSREVSIYCYELNNPNYEFEHLFFSGNFLDINRDDFYIQEDKTANVYTFCRVIE